MTDNAAYASTTARLRAKGRPKRPRRQNLKLMTWANDHLKDILVVDDQHLRALTRSLLRLWSRPFQQFAHRAQGLAIWKNTKEALSGILQDLVRKAEEVARRGGPDLVREAAHLLSGTYSFQDVAERLRWDPSHEELSTAKAAQSFASLLSTAEDLSTVVLPEEDGLVPLAYGTWLAKLRVTVFACILDSSRIPTTITIWHQRYEELNSVLPGLSDKLDGWWHAFCRDHTARRYADSSVAARLAWNRWQVDLRARVMRARGQSALRDIKAHEDNIAAAANIILQQTPSVIQERLGQLISSYENQERYEAPLPGPGHLDGEGIATPRVSDPSQPFLLPAQAGLLDHETSGSPFDFYPLSSPVHSTWLGGAAYAQQPHAMRSSGYGQLWHDPIQPLPLTDAHHPYGPQPFGEPFGVGHPTSAQPFTFHPSAPFEAFPPPSQPTVWPVSQQAHAFDQPHAHLIHDGARYPQPIWSGPFHVVPRDLQWSQSAASAAPTFGNPLPSSNPQWRPRARLALGHGPVIARRIARRVYGLDADKWSRGKSWPVVTPR